MNTAFLFLDECAYAPLDLAALTGVLVPAERYADVRDAMCQLAADVQPTPPNVIPGVIEFHARELLTELQPLHGDKIDSIRLQVFERVTGLIAEHNLAVCRVAYLNRTQIAKLMPLDLKLYGITFSGMQSWLQNIMEDTLVIPIMDGVPGTGGLNMPRRAPNVDPVLIRAFAGGVRFTHHLRQYPSIANSLTLANTHNLGEPVFADSAHSVLLQLVDVVSHLLLQRERAELEGESSLSVFRQRSLAIARTMPSNLLHLWSGKMQIVGAAAAQQAVEADGRASS